MRNTVLYKIILLTVVSMYLPAKVHAFEFKRKVTKDTILANQLHLQADSLFLLKKYKDATVKYIDAAGLCKKHEIWYMTVHNYRRAGVSELSRKQYDSAYLYLNIAKDLSENYLDLNIVKNKEEITRVYDFIGHIYYDKLNYNSAIEFYSKALQIIEELVRFDSSLKVRKVASLNYIGSSYFYKRDYNLALDYGFKALNLQIELRGENDPKTTRYYNNIASIYREKKDYVKSIEYYKKVIDIMNSYPDKNSYTLRSSYNNLGLAYFELGLYKESLDYFTKVLEMAEKSYNTNSVEVARALNNLGQSQMALKDFENAFKNTKKALEINKIISGEMDPEYALNLASLGDCYLAINDKYSAIGMYKSAVKIYKEYYGNKSVEIALHYNNIGSIYLQEQNYSTALDYFQKAIISSIKGFDLLSSNENPKLFKFGYNYHSDINDSIFVLSKPLLFKILKNKAEAFYLAYINDKTKTKFLKFSFDNYQLAINLLDIIRKEMTAKGSKYMLSDEAKFAYTKYIKVAYELYVLFPDENYKESIFNICEMSKSSVLKDQIDETSALNNSSIPQKLIEEEKKLTLDLSYYKTQRQKYIFGEQLITDSTEFELLENLCFDLSYRYDTLLNYIEKTYPQYNPYKNRSSYIVKEIQNKIDNEMIILNYFVGNDNIYILTIDQEKYNVSISPIDSLFENTVYDFYKSIKKYQMTDFLETGSLLYEKLVAPIKRYIDHKQKLVIIPNDYLYYVPFETLFDNQLSEKDKITYSDLNYLVKDYEISYYHTTTMWYDNITNQKNNKYLSDFLGFAPVFNDSVEIDDYSTRTPREVNTSALAENLRSVTIDGKKFISLPYSEQEVRGISNLFTEKGLEADIYLHDKATEKKFKESVGGYKYVHISTHGFSNDKEPQLSGIVFFSDSNNENSQGSKFDDGILYSSEISSLEFDAELVILSSCEGGIGKLITGEGLIALTHGFIQAGVPNILFSLWKVSDKQTCNFMQDFYKFVLNGKTYTQALRLTKIKMIDDPNTALPRIWSSFVLIGS